GTRAAGVSADLGPDGTHFNLPVTVTLPFVLPSGVQPSQLMIFAQEGGGGTYEIVHDALQISGALVTFTGTGLTRFQPGISDYSPPPPDDGGIDAGCADGFAACPLDDGGVLCADTTSDPNNCGSCGYVCPQDLCGGSQCIYDGGSPNDGGPDSGT